MKASTAEPARKTIPKSKRPLPRGKQIQMTAMAEVRKASAHEALRQFDVEQIAELALLGLRYRALGAGPIDFNDPSRLDVYWTGTRMVEKAVNEAVKASKSGGPLAWGCFGVAEGHLRALIGCSVISNETYMEQWRLLAAAKHSRSRPVVELSDHQRSAINQLSELARAGQ